MIRKTIRNLRTALVAIGFSAGLFSVQAQPGVESIGSLQNPDGSWQVSVTFTGDIVADSVDAANFSLSAGTITGLEFYEAAGDHVPDAVSQSVVLSVTGLQAGSTYSVTVSGVADAAGGVMAEATVEYLASDIQWGEIGVPLTPGRAVSMGDGGFDLISSGRTQWAMYDETILAYKTLEGDFNVKAQVVDQEFASIWARAGIMARETLDLGAAEGSIDFSRYLTSHANPKSAIRNDDTAPEVTPDGGNNTYEANGRLELGGASTGGSAPLGEYPGVWVRLQRNGESITAYNSSDGRLWSATRTAEFPGLNPTLYVGPSYSAETQNIGSGTSRDSGPAIDRLFLSQIRNFSELPIVTSEPSAGAVFADASTGLSVNIRSRIGIADGGVSLSLNGNSVPFDQTGDSNDTTITFNELQANVVYNAEVGVTDANGAESVEVITFDTLSLDNLTIEAEDWNFDGGQFIQDPEHKTFDPGPGNYLDLVGIEGIDEQETDGAGDHIY
ncbi:MAG TPA: hypothetical protein EYG38_21335, partial [Verrucomicrobia bacterium]|nr:hypothetical protein [Verrucomicrobiota bacterium]